MYSACLRVLHEQPSLAAIMCHVPLMHQQILISVVAVILCGWLCKIYSGILRLLISMMACGPVYGLLIDLELPGCCVHCAWITMKCT